MPLLRAEEFTGCALTFERALELTLIQSPALKSTLAEIEEREGERIQSGLYPNPLISYSVENVLGNKNWQGWKAAESRYEISQPIEIGGQREHRSRAALYHRYAAEAEYARLQLETFNKLKKSFISVMAAQELLTLASEQKKTAEEVLKTVQAKLDAGKVSPIEKNKARIGLANSELALQKALVDLEVGKRQLSLFWGSTCPDFERVEYPFFDIDCPGQLEEFLDWNRSNPAALEAYFREWAAFEELELERAIRIPDVVITVGCKTIQDTGDKGLILGAAFPLPFFDRNQGNIRKARGKISQTAHRYMERYILLESKLSLLHQEAMRAYQEAMHFKTHMLELASESFDLARQGYEAGKFEYAELLDSQKTLFEMREKYINALFRFLEKQVDIEFLTL